MRIVDSDLVGRSFGDFRIKSQLGEGGGGIVYLAEQQSLGRDVALKVLIERQDASSANRFLREVRLAARLDHPFAAHVYAFGAEPDHTLWIAMELVRGTPLDRLLEGQGAIPLARFVPFFDRLCEVLAAAHDQGIVHRDVKPANIMVLQRAGRLMPKLLDLGIARVTAFEQPEGPQDGEQPEGRDVDGTSLGATTLTSVDSLQLTRAGAFVGTPHYMAPEQWVRASHVDGRADIYSLALLAYECLTGRKPFVGKTVRDLARCHARQALPRLGDGFPSELDDVLAKGAAKKLDERYDTTLELAAALRQASRLGLEPTPLPQLPESLRDNWLHAAPQPIAETVEIWEAARAPRQALDAIGSVATALVRYLAMLALAARLRVGSGAGGDDGETRELLTKLRAGRLDDLEWLALGGRLAAPFADRRAAHPLPELLRFYLEEGAARARELLAAIATARGANDDALETPLQIVVARLGQVLEASTFVFDYPLVVGTELWMGPRRATRALARTQVAADGAARLIDGDGAEVLALAPLVQSLTPSGGAPDELFLLDGEGRGGARLVTWPASFERHDEQLWSQLAERGLAIDAGTHAVAQVESPYKGLATFSRDDADNYFGREKESEAFANRLRHGRFLAVVGPSGTGKSSFVLAGVLPLLPASYTPIVFRPSATPRAAWNARLEAADADALAARIPDGQTWVIVVDQFEELVTLCADPAERVAFASLLLAAARHPSGKLRVVATLRDDFLIAIQQLAPFVDMLSSSLQLLGTPGREDLERVITEPARRVGYAFDDTTLPARMVEEVSDKPGALALLSFTAAQMWELRDRQLHLLRAKVYQALGGVGGALAHHAEATLDAMGEGERPHVRELFRHLVTAQGTRAVLSKQEAEELLGGSAGARAVIEKLIAARLIVSSESAATGDSIEIIHEALIGAWPRLVGWQREDAESVRLRDSLRASARQWADRGRPSGLLWRKEALAEYRAWRPRFAGRLTQLETEFTAASLRDESRARMLRRLAIAVTVVSLAAGLGIATRSWLVQKHKLVETWKEQARVAMMAGHPVEALLYADAADRAGGSSPRLDHILGAAASALSGAEHYVGDARRGFQLVRSSPDERYTLALGDGPVVLFDTAAATEVASWNVPCPNGAFAPAGDRIALGCLDGKLRIIDVTSHAIREVATASQFDVLFELSPDGRYFAPSVDGDTETAFAWDGTPAYRVTVPGAKNLTLVFSRSGGGALISGDFNQYPDSFDGVTIVDDHGREVWTVKPLPRPARLAAFDPAGHSLALALLDHSVEVLDLDLRQVRWVAQVHHDYIRSLAFDSTGARLLTSGNDGIVHVLDAKTGQSLAVPTSPGGAVRTAVWLPGDREILVGAASGTIARVDASSGQTVWEYDGHTGTIQSINLLPRAGDFVSGSEDGAIWRWPLARSFGRVVDPEATAVWAKPAGIAVARRAALQIRTGDGVDVPLAVTDIDHPELAYVDFSGSGAAAIAYKLEVTMYERRGASYGAVWTHRFAKALANVAVSNDGALVATIDNAGAATVFDRGGAIVAQFQASEGDYANLAFDTADRLIVMTTSGELHIYTPRTGQLARKLAAHVASAHLAYGTHAGEFVTFGIDEVVKVWSDADWSAPRAELVLGDSPNAVIVDPTGRFAAVVESSPRIVVYDLTTRAPLSYARLGTPATQAVASPEGLLAATRDGLVAVPVFFAHPLRETIETLARCRLGKALDDEQIVPRAPHCARSK